MMRSAGWLSVGLALAVCLALASCRNSTPPSQGGAATAGLQPTPGLPWFVNVAAKAGIDFQHFDPATPMYYIRETLGSGLAWIDYDNDGWPDLFCVQDGPVLPEQAKGSPPTNKFYRNNGDGTFTDTTEQVGLARSGFGLGCSVGDFDNDGYDDLIVTYAGALVLYHNESDGQGGRRFVDVTAKAGLHDPHLATSCAWGDLDGDGFLDLYVCNYVEEDFKNYPECLEPRQKTRNICPPTVFPLTTHRLFRNNGDGTFSDVSQSSGIAAAPPAAGLGVILCDLDGDGRLEIYIANDMQPAYLFHNQGNMKFTEKGRLSGCALGARGKMIAGMGVEAGDVDGTGRPSLFVTNFQLHGSVLFRNRGRLDFQEASEAAGVWGPSLHHLGFGTVFADVDLDGTLDIATANGHVYRDAHKIGQPFAQEAQLFLGDGKGKFKEVSKQAGPYFSEMLVGRGLAWADFDNDGRPDLAFSNNGGPIGLLKNDTETANNWLRLALVGDGKKSNRNAIGARVTIESGGAKQVRFLNGGGSYLSSSERRLLIGLGPAERAERVVVTWPSGRTQEFRDLQGRVWWRLHEGKPAAEEVRIAKSPR